MADIDYYNGHSAKSFDNHSLGDELNQSVLSDTNSRAGAREFNYSSKSSSSSKNNAEHASNSGSNNQTDLTRNLTTGGETSVGTAVGTSAAVGGVVIATVVIFTSLLGNQFKVVDNSTALSLYRTEENNINLDYSFDVQYDKSGSVYVKLLSTSHNLTSEEYKLTYEDVDSTVTYEEVDEEEAEEPEESHVIEQAKEIYTISINGTFNSLIEGNEYTFAITSVIDGVESRIYSQRLYIPSSYVGVVENSVEAYKDGDTINAFYAFALEYETNSEAYVELKHLVDNDKYVVEQTSETFYLTTEEEQIIDEANKHSYFIDGEFTNLEEDNEYIISVITTSGGKTNTPFSQKLIPHFEKEQDHAFEFLYDPIVEFSVESGQVYINYSAEVNAIYDGSVKVEITDVTAGGDADIKTYLVTTSEPADLISRKEVILGHEYLVTFTSTINDYSEEMWSDTLLADGEFGYIQEESVTFEAYTAFDGPDTYHYINYEFEFMTACSGEDLTIKAYDIEYNLVGEDIIYEAFTHNGEQGYMPWTVEGSLEANVSGPFDVEIYATYGSERLIDSFRVNEHNTYTLGDKEPSVSIQPENGVLKLFYNASVEARFDGSVIVDITDATNDYSIESKEFEITAASSTSDSDIANIDGSVEVTPGHSYEVTLTSYIDGYESVLWTGSATAEEVYGEVVEQATSFAAISYPDDNGDTQHKLTYSVGFSSQIAGSNLLLRVYDSEEQQIGNDVILASEFTSTASATTSIVKYEDSLNLNVEGPYKVQVYATYASEQLLYTTTVQETEANFYDVNEDNFGYEVYYHEDQQAVILDIFIEPLTIVADGYIYVELVNRNTGELITSPNEIAITSGQTDVTSVNTNMTLADMTIPYSVRVRSVIEEDILVYTADINALVPFGEVVNAPTVQSIYVESNNEMDYILELSFKSYIAGTVYFVITDDQDRIVYTYDSQSYTSYQADETKNITNTFFYGDLEEGVTYTITLYGDWGQGEVEIDSYTFEISNYGISADATNAVSDYDNQTFTIPVTITNPNGNLSDFEAILIIENQEIYGVYNAATSSFVFNLSEYEITKGIYGELTITATDSLNLDQTIEFVHIAIWY